MRTKVRSINFKWNPFTMTGEAPASLRFKSGLEELEFASKEDLELINTNPQLQKVHKSMLAGVQKKLQSFNEEKRGLQTQLDTLTNQVGELDEGLQEWEDWAKQNKGLITKLANAGGGDPNDDGRGEGGRKVKGGQSDDERYNKLIEEINRGASQMMNQFQTELGKSNRMLKLSLQLNDLQRKNPEMDAEKVLDVALRKGYFDLTKAYADEEAYGKEIFDKEVEVRLKPRLEEEIAKRNTNIETGSGSMPISFELPKEMPKSFEDAGSRFLTERAKEETKP